MKKRVVASKNASEFLIVFGLLLLAVLVRGQTFGNPVIGFDEQFYLLVGDGMWHGMVPYVDIFDRKPIGLFLIYAVADGIGGDGFFQYKLVALGFVVATAYLVYCGALRISTPFSAIVVACLYIFWLNFMEGEGGQSEVFFNLPMIAAGLIAWRAFETRRHVLRRGVETMLLVGVALQIKYTVVFEGIFFGCALLWTHWLVHKRVGVLMLAALLWIGCALLPTILAAAWYWHIGALQQFVFANFFSMFGKHVGNQIYGSGEIILILLPLLLLSWPCWRRDASTRFVCVWIFASILGVMVMGSYGTSHYGMPILVPATLAAAPFFAAAKRAKLYALIIMGLLFIAAQVVLARVEFLKGGNAAARAIASAARPTHGCIYVYDGYPALYMLTHSCLPTRWAFPGHLNTQDEAFPAALGIDPVAEETRILATHPEVIVTDTPAYAGVNLATHALVQAALAKDYRLALRYRTGAVRDRLVYRLK
ncbi:glycosyltransferase family 39 protein [Sphingomonas bacterium]|uniref:ArnT family glycosyltransferase n=1 Tax=Sphingomonas bacterium TaxID=1895847 RepID=UPI0015755744|nr:hypothetical protein [Sphingomonas bacterium]